MICGIGIDIIEVARIEKLISGEKNRFRKLVFTDCENEYCEGKINKAQNYAVRFAAKEAFFKALGTGMRDGLRWKEIEILNDELGKPNIICAGVCQEKLNQFKVKHIHVSLTHTAEYGAATVILEK